MDEAAVAMKDTRAQINVLKTALTTDAAFQSRVQNAHKQGEAPPPRLKVGVVGIPAAGKSTLINTLLGVDVFPVGANGAVSACAAIVHGTTNATATAVVIFKSRETVEISLQDAFKAISPGDDRDEECMSFEEGHQFLKDLWPDHFTSPSSFDVNELKQHKKSMLDELEAFLGKKRSLTCETVEQLADVVGPYTRADSSGGGRKLWRVTESVDIGLPLAKSVALGTNLDLVDLPGLGDASSAREDVTTKYLSSLNHLLIITPASRAITDRLAGDLWNKHQHTIKLAKIKITFVVSKCDDFGGSMIPALVKEITKGDDELKDAVKKLLPQFERAEVDLATSERRMKIAEKRAGKCSVRLTSPDATRGDYDGDSTMTEPDSDLESEVADSDVSEEHNAQVSCSTARIGTQSQNAYAQAQKTFLGAQKDCTRALVVTRNALVRTALEEIFTLRFNSISHEIEIFQVAPKLEWLSSKHRGIVRLQGYLRDLAAMPRLQQAKALNEDLQRHLETTHERLQGPLHTDAAGDVRMSSVVDFRAAERKLHDRFEMIEANGNAGIAYSIKTALTEVAMAERDCAVALPKTLENLTGKSTHWSVYAAVMRHSGSYQSTTQKAKLDWNYDFQLPFNRKVSHANMNVFELPDDISIIPSQFLTDFEVVVREFLSTLVDLDDADRETLSVLATYRVRQKAFDELALSCRRELAEALSDESLKDSVYSQLKEAYAVSAHTFKTEPRGNKLKSCRSYFEGKIEDAAASVEKQDGSLFRGLSLFVTDKLKELEEHSQKFINGALSEIYFPLVAKYSPASTALPVGPKVDSATLDRISKAHDEVKKRLDLLKKTPALRPRKPAKKRAAVPAERQSQRIRKIEPEVEPEM